MKITYVMNINLISIMNTFINPLPDRILAFMATKNEENCYFANDVRGPQLFI